MSKWTASEDTVTGEQIGYPRTLYRACAYWTDAKTGNSTAAQHWTSSRAALSELVRSLRGRWGLEAGFVVFAEKHHWAAKDCRVEVTAEETTHRDVPRDERVEGIRAIRDAFHNRGIPDNEPF